MTTYAGGSAGQGQGRPTTRLGSPVTVLPADFGGYPEAGKTLYSGVMVGQDAAGNIVDLSDATNPALNVLGILRATVINVANTGSPGATGSAGVAWGGGPLDILAGGWTVIGDATVTATTPLGTDLYALDNQTVSTEAQPGKLRAGWFAGLDAFGNVYCVFGPSPFAANLASSASPTTINYARAVVTSLQAMGGTTTGTLTETTNGALAAQDGVTIAVGDVVMIPEGVTNLAAASDAGPYVVTAIGGASAKWSMTRPSWWATGAQIPNAELKVGPEGTLFFSSTWKSFAPKGSQAIDTNAPKLYPGSVSQSVTLVAGTKTITNVPIWAATSQIIAVRTAAGGTTTTTIMYAPAAAPTPGVIGTASIAVQAEVAAGTIQNADTSVLTVTILNWS